MTDSPLSPPQRVHTRGMSYGPHAVGHLDGKVVFVRGGAPDEEADVVVRESRPRYAFADLHAVVAPSPARRETPCPYLPACGGCPWQHLDYQAQLAAKQESVREHVHRIARLDVPVLPTRASPQPFGYRHRLKLRVENRRVGFLHAASHDLVPIAHCLLAMSNVDASIRAAQALVERVHTAVRRVEIVDRGMNDGGVVLVAEAEGGFEPRDAEPCGAWLDHTAQVHGLVLTGRGWRRVWGDEHVVVRPEPDVALTVRAGSFTQVNPRANQLLVSTVLEHARMGAGMRVLDLYAGAGNFSIPAARRGARVLAVEQRRAACEDGRVNAQMLIGDDAGACEFRACSAQTAVADLAQRAVGFDVVLLDPPRSGAADIVPTLLTLAAPRLIYVSCNPSSLARDLAQLSARYRVDVVQPIDLFPHSYHVEVVVTAKLAC